MKKKLSKEYIEKIKKEKCWLCRRNLFEDAHYYQFRGRWNICIACRTILKDMIRGDEKRIDSFYGNEDNIDLVDVFDEGHHITKDDKL